MSIVSQESVHDSHSLDVLCGQIPVAPTRSSNWLIPGRLIIGGYPSNTDAVHLVKTSGVDTFVNLEGRDTEETYRSQMYPAAIAAMVTGLADQIRFIHFPIEDAGVVPVSQLVGLVKQLMELTMQGRTLFVHCQSGRG